LQSHRYHRDVEYAPKCRGLASKTGLNLPWHCSCSSGADAVPYKEADAMTTRRSVPMLAVLAMTLVTFSTIAFAQKLADSELKRLGATSATAADHKKLAAHYRAHAAEHEADAKVHEAIIAAARKQDIAEGHAWELVRAADHYAEHSREAAEALIDLAKLHEGMAEVATESGKKAR
jgi:hypothetical protein